MTDLKKKVGLLGGAMVGALAAAGAAAEDMPSTESIGADVNARIGAAGISIGSGGGTINTGGGNAGGSTITSGAGTVASGDVSETGSMDVGGDEGLAIADASGGNHNVGFAS